MTHIPKPVNFDEVHHFVKHVFHVRQAILNYKNLKYLKYLRLRRGYIPHSNLPFEEMKKIIYGAISGLKLFYSKTGKICSWESLSSVEFPIHLDEDILDNLEDDNKPLPVIKFSAIVALTGGLLTMLWSYFHTEFKAYDLVDRSDYNFQILSSLMHDGYFMRFKAEWNINKWNENHLYTDEEVKLARECAQVYLDRYEIEDVKAHYVKNCSLVLE